MKRIVCRQTALDMMNEELNRQVTVKTSHGELTFNDMLVEVKDTCQVEVLSELKNYIVAMFDSEIVYRLNNQHLKGDKHD